MGYTLSKKKVKINRWADFSKNQKMSFTWKLEGDRTDVLLAEVARLDAIRLLLLPSLPACLVGVICSYLFPRVVTPSDIRSMIGAKEPLSVFPGSGFAHQGGKMKEADEEFVFVLSEGSDCYKAELFRLHEVLTRWRRVLDPLPFEQHPLAVCASPFFVVFRHLLPLDGFLQQLSTTWADRVRLLAAICHIGSTLEERGLQWQNVHAPNILISSLSMRQVQVSLCRLEANRTEEGFLSRGTLRFGRLALQILTWDYSLGHFPPHWNSRTWLQGHGVFEHARFIRKLVTSCCSRRHEKRTSFGVLASFIQAESLKLETL